jgi:hypothetical protein
LIMSTPAFAAQYATAPKPAQFTTISSDPNVSRAAAIAASDLALIRNVGEAADCPIAELAREDLDRPVVHIAEQDAGAGLDERGRNRPPDPRGGASYDGAFAF